MEGWLSCCTSLQSIQGHPGSCLFSLFDAAPGSQELLSIGKFEPYGEFLRMSRSAAVKLDIHRKGAQERLGSLLQFRLVVLFLIRQQAGRPDRFVEPGNDRTGLVMPPVKIDSAQQGFNGVSQQGGPLPSALGFFSLAHEQGGSQIQVMGDLGEPFFAYQS